MEKKRWRTNTLIGGPEKWFYKLGLTEDEALDKAKKILLAVHMESEVLEGALQWDEFVWSVCHSPNEAERIQNSWKDLNTIVGARRFVMYMTS